MAEIKRTSTDLLTNLFQDGQAANAISEQDQRDHIASMIMPYGGGYMEGNATETVISSSSSYVDIAGTFTQGNVLEFTMSSGGVLTYTGTPDRHFHLVSNFSMISAGNAKIYRFSWFKNTSTRLLPYIDRMVGTGSDVGAVSLHADAMLSNGDTLQLKVSNESDTTNMTVEAIYAFAQGMFL